MYQYSIVTETKIVDGDIFITHRDEFPATLTLSAVIQGLFARKAESIENIKIKVKEAWRHDV